MRRLLLVTVLVPVLSGTALAEDLTGMWTFEWKPDFSGHDQTRECAFAQHGRKLTIECDGARMVGQVNGQKVTLQHPTGKGDQITATYRAVLDGTHASMSGTWHLAAPENRDGRFEARRHQPQ